MRIDNKVTNCSFTFYAINMMQWVNYLQGSIANERYIPLTKHGDNTNASRTENFQVKQSANCTEVPSYMKESTNYWDLGESFLEYCSTWI